MNLGIFLFVVGVLIACLLIISFLAFIDALFTHMCGDDPDDY